jgi:hypothetical protein
MSDKNKSNGDSSVKSGCSNKTEYPKVLGGYPEKKNVEAIDRQNSPQGRKRAPGSVRV